MTRIRETAVKEMSGRFPTKFFIAMGAPGCGKGTLCAYLKEDPNYFHLSTGDLLRKEVKESTQLGIEAEEIMEKGGLVPDDLVIELVKKNIKKLSKYKYVIFDGFPRTREQAEKLDKLIKISKVLYLDVSDELVLERICGRRVHMPSGRSYHVKFNPPKKDNIDDETGDALTQRADDNEETVKSRLAEYKEKTKPLIDYYSAKVVNLDGAEEMTRIRETAVKEMSGRYPNIIIIVMGPPGSGKGTLCNHLIKDNVFHFQTSEILKTSKYFKNNREVLRSMKEGQLIEDELVNNAFQFEIGNVPSKFRYYLIDGYPRTQSQLEFLTEKFKIAKIIQLEMDEKTSYDRLKFKLVHSASGRVYNSRLNPPQVPNKDDITGEPLKIMDDDTDEAIQQRIDNYNNITKNLFNEFNSKIIKIDATLTLNEILQLAKGFLNID